LGRESQSPIRYPLHYGGYKTDKIIFKLFLIDWNSQSFTVWRHEYNFTEM